eukprot:CAMPEP_0179964824 /NCGR_PEP_ID=MMETSP0983-20121128/31534_1 /TAXON_ID=483367 /ORGANISM="non described non described, Strain CCMP 2436" /LENGTH=101 /DNA_ID=CAMNT_0021877575 /DNA_START=60 /DNA_END=362 /DNA_ORIENTATION=+
MHSRWLSSISLASSTHERDGAQRRSPSEPLSGAQGGSSWWTAVLHCLSARRVGSAAIEPERIAAPSQRACKRHASAAPSIPRVGRVGVAQRDAVAKPTHVL